MSSHRKNVSIKVNGREVENPAARMIVGLVMGLAGVAALAIGVLFVTGMAFIMVPVAFALLVAAGVASALARKG